MGWLCAAATAGIAVIVAGTAQAGAEVERGAAEAAALAGESSGFVPVNAPVQRRCDFIHDPQCTGIWSPRPNARRSAAAAPADAEAATPGGANVAAAACPPGNVVGAKGECIAPKPMATGCPPGNVIGPKGECVAPKPLANGCPPGNAIGAKGECVKPLPMDVPEPGTLPLAALGFAALFALSRRRTRAHSKS